MYDQIFYGNFARGPQGSGPPSLDTRPLRQCSVPSSGSMACILKHGGGLFDGEFLLAISFILIIEDTWIIGVFFILKSRKSISDCRQFAIGYFLYSTIETIDSKANFRR